VPSPEWRASDAETEVALVTRLRARDTSALEVLMQRYASRVYRVAFGITRNQADAEEVTQDSFLALFEKIHTFDGRAALGSWLYRIATNAALSKGRGKRLKREVSLDAQLPTFLEDGHRAGEPSFLLADWSRNPEEDLLSAETQALLRRGIAALPERYRAVVVLRDIEELSYEDVAEILGESVSSVKSRLHRARMALREHVTGSLHRAIWGRSGRSSGQARGCA
jgi:RNA polymerase sigma-70 factor, ECF subfamily